MVWYGMVWYGMVVWAQNRWWKLQYVKVSLSQSHLWGQTLLITVFPKNVISPSMKYKIPGNTINTKYFTCASQLHCNVVFFCKFHIVTCQNLSGGKQIYFANLWNRSKDKSQYLFWFFQDLNFLSKIIFQVFSWYASNLRQRSFTIHPHELKKISCKLFLEFLLTKSKSVSFAQFPSILWVVQN